MEINYNLQDLQKDLDKYTAEQSAGESIAIDCRYFAEWDRPYFYASALDAVFVRPFTAAEQTAFSAAWHDVRVRVRLWWD